MKAKSDGAIIQFVLIKWFGVYSTQCALRYDSNTKNMFKFYKHGYKILKILF